MSGVGRARVAVASLIMLCACVPALASTGAADPGSPTERRAQDLPRIDRAQLIRDLSVLAHDSMQGRRSGTPGVERARRFLVAEFENRGFSRLRGERTQEFELRSGGAGEPLGANVLGMIRGLEFPERYLVISAHYDHLGVENGEIYNGADDNASGTAALLSVGDYFLQHPPRHSLVLVAFDAEEVGLLGARRFIADPPIPLDDIVMDVNLDMVSRSDSGELYAAGTYHYPFLEPLVEEVAGRAEISLLLGHDSPRVPGRDDWTNLSDHGAFHQAGIPFLYFGVEDHRDYHRSSDTFENVTLDFYVSAVETIVDFVSVADRDADRLN